MKTTNLIIAAVVVAACAAPIARAWYTKQTLQPGMAVALFTSPS
jgi:hypothetical protein